ncbi:hypothetical protein Hanom_Chr12g01116421 [Helianthus anomalus]
MFAAGIYTQIQNKRDTKISLNVSINVSINHCMPAANLSNPKPLLSLSMLPKLFGSRSHNIVVAAGEKPLILQIIHAGGMVERYYMAFPAAWIMDKYPNFILARPEIFQRPWDSVVHPDEILVPGHKYFVVPIRTVRKLHRRIQKPSVEMPRCLFGVAEDEGKPKKKTSNGKRFKKKNLRFSPKLTVIYED